MNTLIIISLLIALVFTFLIVLIIRKASNHNVSSIQTMIKQGKPGQAIEPLRKLITKDPHNVDAHFLLAKAFIGDNKPELALMEVKTINKLGEFSPICPEKDFRKLSSKLFMQFNQHEEALKDLVLLIKLAPYESENYYNVGLLFEERQKSSKAAKYFKKTTELEPRHAGAYLHLGMIMFNSKRYKEAKHYLEQAIKYDETSFITYFYLGKIAKEARDFTGAVSAFEKSLRDKSIKLKALIERGLCYIALNKYETAATELEKAITLVTKDTEVQATEQQILYANYFLAMAYEQLRNLDKAIDLWELIYKKKRNFKDVAEKLSQYKELRENDNMKDYLTSTHDEFVEICKAICTQLKLTTQDIKQIKGGVQLIGLESGKKDWKASKKLPFLVRLLRESTPLNESTVRNTLDEMKNLNIMKGILVSSSEITSDAKKFAESRPIDLIGKRKLVKILNNI